MIEQLERNRATGKSQQETRQVGPKHLQPQVHQVETRPFANRDLKIVEIQAVSPLVQCCWLAPNERVPVARHTQQYKVDHQDAT